MPLTRIKFAMSKTLNMGNYQSTKVDVGIEMDVPKGSTRDEVYDEAVDFVTEKLDEKVDEIKL